MSSQLIFQIQNMLILALLITGVAFRHRRSLHVKIMMSGIIWDLLLVLQIELTRKAVDKAMQVAGNPWLLNYHIAVAILCVVLYGVMFYTGTRMLKNDPIIRPWHRMIGWTTLGLRISTFITSFLVVKHDGI